MTFPTKYKATWALVTKYECGTAFIVDYISLSIPLLCPCLFFLCFILELPISCINSGKVVTEVLNSKTKPTS